MLLMCNENIRTHTYVSTTKRLSCEQIFETVIAVLGVDDQSEDMEQRLNKESEERRSSNAIQCSGAKQYRIKSH